MRSAPRLSVSGASAAAAYPAARQPSTATLTHFNNEPFTLSLHDVETEGILEHYPERLYVPRLQHCRNADALHVERRCSHRQGGVSADLLERGVEWYAIKLQPIGAPVL